MKIKNIINDTIEWERSELNRSTVVSKVHLAIYNNSISSSLSPSFRTYEDSESRGGTGSQTNTLTPPEETDSARTADAKTQRNEDIVSVDNLRQILTGNKIKLKSRAYRERSQIIKVKYINAIRFGTRKPPKSAGLRRAIAAAAAGYRAGVLHFIQRFKRHNISINCSLLLSSYGGS